MAQAVCTELEQIACEREHPQEDLLGIKVSRKDRRIKVLKSLVEIKEKK